MTSINFAPYEHPILFSGEMVSAILDGRKTQTRRPVIAKSWNPNKHSKVQVINYGDQRLGTQAYFINSRRNEGYGIPCPYGVIGDHLWVRETWCNGDIFYQSYENDPPEIIGYRADHSAIDYCTSTGKPKSIPDHDIKSWNWDKIRWRPSTHMPRWASRLTLKITNITVERLQSLSEEDAVAEGFPLPTGPGRINGKQATVAIFDARLAFQKLWDAYTKTATWKSNPWVWVISFKRMEHSWKK